MELPLMVSPESLDRLRDELAAVAGRIGRLAGRLEALGVEVGWQGEAQQAFARATQALAAQCDELASRLIADSGRVERLAEQLAAELAVLHRLEHQVLGALRRLAARAVDDVSGAARSVYDRISRRLPGHGSPDWRGLASGLVDGELL